MHSPASLELSPKSERRSKRLYWSVYWIWLSLVGVGGVAMVAVVDLFPRRSRVYVLGALCITILIVLDRWYKQRFRRASRKFAVGIAQAASKLRPEDLPFTMQYVHADTNEVLASLTVESPHCDEELVSPLTKKMSSWKQKGIPIALVMRYNSGQVFGPRRLEKSQLVSLNITPHMMSQDTAG